MIAGVIFVLAGLAFVWCSWFVKFRLGKGWAEALVILTVAALYLAIGTWRLTDWPSDSAGYRDEIRSK
jgi:hypothetical protein